MFTNRREAGYQLAQHLKGRPFTNLLVLGIPRGGVEVAAALSRELEGELDIFLSKKLSAPEQPELAVGAVAEDGRTFIHPIAYMAPGVTPEYLDTERRHCMAELARRGRRLRNFREPADVEGRSIILVDDGVATGSTVIAALETLKTKRVKETLVAVPVIPNDVLESLIDSCDEVIYLEATNNLHSVGRFYQDFSPTDEEEVGRLLSQSRDRFMHDGWRATP